MRAEPRANVQCAKRVGAHAVRRPQMPDQERVRENGVFRYVAILTVLVATLAFVALDTFSVQRARLADFLVSLSVRYESIINGSMSARAT